jgi:hypothetical protein
MKFRESPRSVHAKIQLAFANLYGLFEEEWEPADRMIAGLAMHDLEMFPQSCPRPDLSYLPPRSVLECSDLWSLRKGAGLFAWCGAVVPVVAKQIRTIVVYLAIGPAHNAAFYRRTGFVEVGDAVVYPYAERLDGGEIRVQPMILEGQALQKLARSLSRFISRTSEDQTKIRLKSFPGLRPVLDHRTFPELTEQGRREAERATGAEGQPGF